MLPPTSSFIGSGDSSLSLIGIARGATTAVQGADSLASVSHHRRTQSLFPLHELSIGNLPSLKAPTGMNICAGSTSRSFATVAKNVSARVQFPTFHFPPATTPGALSSSSILPFPRRPSHKLKRTLSIDTALASASFNRRPRKFVITADENDQEAGLLPPGRPGSPFELRRVETHGMRSEGLSNNQQVTSFVDAASNSTSIWTAPPGITATVRTPAPPLSLRLPQASSNNDSSRSDIQDQSTVTVTFPDPISGQRNTSKHRVPSRSENVQAFERRGLCRSARASVSSYDDPSDGSDYSTGGPRRASTSQLSFRSNSASRQAVSVATSTSDNEDDNDLAPPLSSRLSYPDDARKITEAGAALRLQSSRAQDMSEEKGRVLFAKTWLKSCYEPFRGFNVSRSALYASYVNACQRFSVSALNISAFGRIIRAVHPKVLTRRLGGRADSRYHYIDFRPSNSREYNTLFASESHRHTDNAASGPPTRLPSPFRAADPVAVVAELPEMRIGEGSTSVAQNAVELGEAILTVRELVKSAEKVQPRSLTRRRTTSVKPTRAPVPSRRPTWASGRLVVPNIKLEECPITPILDSCFFRSFEGVFDVDKYEDQSEARAFWQSLEMHFSRLEEAVRLEKYDLFLDELKEWWTNLTADECEIAVTPAASRSIYRAFVAIYELVLDSSRKALLALAPLAQLESLGILAAKIGPATVDALQDFSDTFFFDTLVGLSKQVGPLCALSQSCRVWANKLQSSLGAQQAWDEFEQVWRSVNTVLIQNRCELIQAVDSTLFHTYTALVEVLFEVSISSPSIESRLGRVIEHAALSFDDLLRGQKDSASILAEYNLIGSQIARELSLSHPRVAVHFQSLHFLIEDLLVLHVLQGQVLQTERIVSAPVVKPAVATSQIATLGAIESEPEGTGPPVADKMAEPAEVVEKSEGLLLVSSEPLPTTALSEHPSSPARDLTTFASPPRMIDSGPEVVTSLPIPSIVRQSPAALLIDKSHSISSAPVWMPPRRAPLVGQAVQRANLAQDLLALESPPPFVLSSTMQQSLADRQREVGPARSKLPVSAGHEMSSERRGLCQPPSGFEVGRFDDEGVGSSTAAAAVGAKGGALLDPAGLTDEVPNTAAFYAGYWR
ncbi:BZ3500_MvSof-1268-A1-R1_Chr10-1g02682 [Microbotryum saponariae]|uniref:BZ3500_MvSof-1268-A1-R1_Chr10-1g02682 protein n=1 Tax=Microbotryum saponariae TaxID=289078 RepID=A0A2X0LGV3_9BASI|nr:BZ3500_MvSof-1268-A1-R1_Chr10-1g02682 [Microbotryum saponariae]SDA06171.1 BZ3501_MvSof-1269-A2-R1_Chr10-1g02283 [Microbotryum saponariae]